MSRERFSFPDFLIDITRDLIATPDSFEMARAFAHRVLKVFPFDSARLIWPDGQSGDVLRSENLGNQGPRRSPKKISVRFRDHGSVFFRIDFHSSVKKPLSLEVRKNLRLAASLVERAIGENEKRLQQEELNRFHWIRQFTAGFPMKSTRR